jgi:hypothetical protein
MQGRSGLQHYANTHQPISRLRVAKSWFQQKRAARHKVNEAGDLKFVLVGLTHLRAQRPRALQEAEVELFGGAL